MKGSIANKELNMPLQDEQGKLDISHVHMKTTPSKIPQTCFHLKSSTLSPPESTDHHDIPLAVTMSPEDESSPIRGDVHFEGNYFSHSETDTSAEQTDNYKYSNDQGLQDSSVVTASSVEDEGIPPSIPKTISHPSRSQTEPVSVLGCSVGDSFLYASNSEIDVSPHKTDLVHKLPGELLSVSGTSILRSEKKKPRHSSDVIQKLPGELLSLCEASVSSGSSPRKETSQESQVSKPFGQDQVTAVKQPSLDQDDDLETKTDSSSNQRNDRSHPGISEVVLKTLPPSLRSLLDTSLSTASSIEKEVCPSDEENGFTPAPVRTARKNISTPQVCYEEWKDNESEEDCSLLHQSMIGSETEPLSTEGNETKLSLASFVESVPESPPKLTATDLGSEPALSPQSTFRTNTMNVAVEESNTYIRKIEELEERLRRSESEVHKEVEKRKDLEQLVEELQNADHNLVAENNNSNVFAMSMEAGSQSSESSLLNKKEVRFVDHTCVELSEKSIELQKQVDHLQDDLKRSREKNESLHDQLLESTKQGAKWKAQRDTFRDQIPEERNRLKDEVESVRRQLAESQNRVQELSGEVRDSSNNNYTLQQQFQEAQNTIQHMSARLSELPDSVRATVPSGAERYSELCSHMEHQMKALKDLCEEKTNAVSVERYEKISIETERDELRTQFIALGERVKSVLSNMELVSNDICQSVDERLSEYSDKLCVMSRTLNHLRDSIEVKPQTDDNTFDYSCSVSEESRLNSKCDKESHSADNSDSDIVLNATLKQHDATEESYAIEEKRLEMMEEARRDEVSGYISDDEDDLSRLSHIDGLSQLGEDISTIGSIFLESPYAHQTESSHEENVGPLESERKKREEEKRILIARLESAQAEYQKLTDCLACHQEKLKERSSLKASIESQGRLIEILESKVNKLSREKQDLEYNLLKTRRDYDACRSELNQPVSEGEKAHNSEIGRIGSTTAVKARAVSVESLKPERDELENRPGATLAQDEYKKRVAKLQKDLRSKQAKQVEMEGRLEDLTNQVETLTISERNSQSRIHDLQNSLRKSQDEVDKLRSQCTDSVEKLTEQSHSEDSLAVDHVTAVESADKVFKQLSKELAAAKSSVATTQRENELLMSSVSKLEIAIEEKEGSILRKKHLIEVLEEEKSTQLVELEKLKVSYVTCNDKLAQLTRENADKDTRTLQLQAALQQSGKEAEGLRMELAGLNTEISSLKQQLLQATASAEDNSKRIEVLENECTSLAASKSEMSASRNTLIKRVKELEDKLDRNETILTSERRDAQSQIENLRAALRVEDAELSSSRERCLDITKQLEAQKASSVRTAEEIERLQLMNSECNEKLVEVSKRNGVNEGLIEQLKNEVRLAENSAQRATEEAKATSSSLSAAKDEVRRYQVDNEKLIRDVNGARQIVEEKTARISLLENELSKVSTQYQVAESSIAHLTLRHDELSVTVQDLEGTVQASQQKVFQANEEISILISEAAEKQAELDDMVQRCGQHELHVDQLQDSVSQHASEIERLENSYVVCSDELAKVSEQYLKSKTLVSQLQEARDSAEDEVRALRKRHEKLKDHSACQRKLENELAEKDMVVENLRNTCTNMHNSFKEKIAIISERQKACESEAAQQRERSKLLEQQLVMAETEIARADEEIAKTSKALADAQDDLDNAREEARRLTIAHGEAREVDTRTLRDASEVRDSANIRLRETEESVSILMKQLQEYQGKISNLEDRMEQAQLELRVKDEELIEMRSEKTVLQRKCQRRRDYIEQLTTKCENWAVSYQQQAEQLEKVVSQE